MLWVDAIKHQQTLVEEENKEIFLRHFYMTERLLKVRRNEKFSGCAKGLRQRADVYTKAGQNFVDKRQQFGYFPFLNKNPEMESGCTLNS